MKAFVAGIGLALLFLLSGTIAAQDKKAIAYGILIDNTGSMRSQFDTVREIGKAIVHQTHDHGPVALFDFHSQGSGPGTRAVPIARIEATQDEDTLDQAINGFYVEGGQTSLLDAVKSVGDSLDNKFAGANKVIILITDGEDRVSEIQQRTLLKFLQERSIKVFAVGMVQELDSDRGLTRPSTQDKAIRLLNSLTKETGGRVVFPKTRKVDIQSLLKDLSLPIE